MISLSKITNKLQDTFSIPTIQGSYLGKTIQGVLANPRGIHSSPPVDTPCITFHMSRSNKFTVPLNTKRPDGIKENDMFLFAHNLASVLKLMADGEIQINSDNKVVINTNNVIINSDVLVNGNITATGIVTGMTDVVFGSTSSNTHTHSGVQTGSSNTGVPN